METITLYENLSVVLGVLGFIFLLAAVFLFFFLDVGHYIAVLTGSEAKKGVGMIRQAATAGQVQADVQMMRSTGAVISWNNTSGSLNMQPVRNTGRMMPGMNPQGNNNMTVLMTDSSDETQLLME
ncbi:hypothetical protein [Butyrivibrio sp. AE3009]|nr:hypothetical protein [Butyrivibrio sp. AE3009]MDC7292411.1 hypothetical protein [Butyrivibrio sp. DSM 10294]